LSKLNFKYERFLVYYFLLTLFLGKPFVKTTFIPNSNYYFITIFIILIITKYSYELVISYKKNKKLLFSEYLYFTPLFYLLIKFLMLENYSFTNLKKFMILFAIALIIFIHNNRNSLLQNFESVISIFKSKGHLFALLLLIQTVLSKSGTYGLIFWSNDFISQNIYDFKAQRIFLATIFTFLFFESNFKATFNFLQIFNISLLITYSRIVFVMFVISIVLYVLIYKNYRQVIIVTFLVLFIVFSGLVDFFGSYLNQSLADNGGKEFVSLVCAQVLDDNVEINRDDLKNIYIERNVDFGEYLTLPRYFSASNLLETFGLINKVPLYNNGKRNICKNYSYFLTLDNEFIETCNFNNSGKCKVPNDNPLLFNSSAQSVQLIGNVNFRINLWQKTIFAVSESITTILFGVDQNKSLPKAVDPDTDYGELWHGHGSIISILGFFGLLGLIIYLYTIFFIFFNNNDFNYGILIIFFNLIILSVSDAVIETPDLSLLFAFTTGLLKK